MRGSFESNNNEAVESSKEGTISKGMKEWQATILLVGAAHGVLSGQLASGWLDSAFRQLRLKRGEFVKNGQRRPSQLGWLRNGGWCHEAWGDEDMGDGNLSSEAGGFQAKADTKKAGDGRPS